MKNLAIIIIFLTLVSCYSKPENARLIDSLPNIYPDYIDVSIPPNIAPLNFLVRDSCKSVFVTASYNDTEISIASHNNHVCFDINNWKKLINNAINNDIEINVYTKINNREFIKHKSFKIHVLRDSIDPYLTYRLIEPDYEVFSRLKIEQRCIENFDKKDICNYNITNNSCMNCHTFAANNPKKSLFYVRGENGGAILNRNGKLRKLNIKNQNMSSGAVYGHFSLDGRYFVFSTNVIIPGLHADPNKRMEVFDTKSDIYVADLETNKIITSPLLCDSLKSETFPCFSANGKKIFYCSAPALQNDVNDIKNIHYALVSIDFQDGKIGIKTDTIIKSNNISVCLPLSQPWWFGIETVSRSILCWT